MSEYIIVNKTSIEKRIEELKKYCVEGKCSPAEFATFNHSILELKEILSKSIPLIPEIEKAFDAGQSEEYKDISFDGGENYETVRIIKEKQDYLSNLKLDA